jgi:hypothetical protein
MEAPPSTTGVRRNRLPQHGRLVRDRRDGDLTRGDDADEDVYGMT